MTIETMIVDVSKNILVILVNLTGTHTGYFPHEWGAGSDGREWMGILPTSKRFDTRGFMKMKVVSPNRGSLTDLCKLISRVG
jgi:hypothetical protein